jgi:hypothetical protein
MTCLGKSVDNVIKRGALETSFDAYPQRQCVTESININSLADRHIWSTIKTLPATLPEPRSVVRGPSFEAQGPSFTDHCLAATAIGPGLLEGFPISE